VSDDNSGNSGNVFASFMSKKNDEKNGSTPIFGENKTKSALNKAKDEAEEEKKKELTEAKKNSNALANRYGKADMMKMQARNIILMLPFIIAGVVIVMIIFFKGGDLVQKVIQMFFSSLGKK